MYILIYLYPYYCAESRTLFSAFPGPLPTRSHVALRPPPDAAWSRLGRVLGPSGARPGPSLGPVLGRLGPPLDTPGPSWGHLSALAAKKGTLSKTYVFPRFWPLFGLLRSLAAVKLGPTWGLFRHFDKVRRNSFSRCSHQRIKMASRSHSFRFGRPTGPQEVLKEVLKGPQDGAPEGEKTGYEIGLELEGLLGPILEPLGGSFWYHLGAILKPFWCPHGPLGANLLLFYQRRRRSEQDFDHMRERLRPSMPHHFALRVQSSSDNAIETCVVASSLANALTASLLH